MTTTRPDLWSTLALLLCGTVVGYWIGVGKSLNISRGNAEDANKPANGTDAEESDSEDENTGDLRDLGNIKAGMLDECKMVLIVRTDLGMTKGKIAAQCGHATLACYKTLQKNNPALLRQWERTGQAKIALKADSEEELLILEAQAQSLNICARSIQDAGRTQIAAGSRTVLGVGPAPVKLINQVTGHLKLL
ncbi:PTH2-domain-containing protein [Cystobasidium minutum MCA 4210]|uniref:PTH2-domain-containing protein n=1 Tax=Cystobasidium minutum MCA 4210 TaxID=1397322 RepID=UPI0034CFC2E1|eukprot:jgi/Rhomi1/104466/CE104465_340